MPTPAARYRPTSPAGFAFRDDSDTDITVPITLIITPLLEKYLASL
jgi:hypothetical protein